ncbi:MAG: dephospho-CoA kinase [Lachnospiraceae bacterium]|nr:dephospho-CoA kinase [Lachnospiraceae bacterium]
MNLTLTGNLGSGKTTICNILKEKGYEIVSTGKIFRDIAAEKNVSVIELNEMAKKDRSIDDLLDNKTTELGKTLDNVVFDSRLAWNFVPESFKVFLLVDTEEAARRVFQDSERNAESYESAAAAKEGLLNRAGLEKARFLDLYQINYYNASNYNLVIESTAAKPEEIAEEIIKQFESYQKESYPTKVMLNVKGKDSLHKFQEFSLEELKAEEALRDGFFMEF